MYFLARYPVLSDLKIPYQNFPGGKLSYKKFRGALWYRFLWVNKPDLVPLRVFRLKQSTAGAFTVSLRVLNQKSQPVSYCVAKEFVPLRGNKFSSHAHKT